MRFFQGTFETRKRLFFSTFSICMTVPLTGIHFRGELQHAGDVREQKLKHGLFRTREITDIRLLHELYDY